MAQHARLNDDSWRSGRGVALAVGIPLAVLGLLVGAWVVDTYALATDVVRNVEVADASLGGADDAQAGSRLLELAAELEGAPVRLVTPDGAYDTTAGALGLTVDVEATVAAAADAGRAGFIGVRPFRWAASFVAPFEVEPRLAVDRAVAVAALVGIQGPGRLEPTEPGLTLGPDGALVAQPGLPGSGIDVDALVEALPTATRDAGDERPIMVEVPTGPLAPTIPDEAAIALAADANQRTAAPLALVAAGRTEEVDPATVRSWLRSVADGAGGLTLDIDRDAVLAVVAERFGAVNREASDARITLEGSSVVIRPSADGVACCGPDSGDRVLAAIQAPAARVELAATVTPPTLTTEQAQSYRIAQPIGGTRAWPESRQGEVGPGFTTFHAGGQSRVTNIHRMADIVDGAIIAPGATFSINDHVGRRTRANGFVEAGAIAEGVHVEEVGGGVSQFATTLFNSAYFAGLDFGANQAHSEYFDRYPRGREATMGFPEPDLEVVNTTPYGILIDTSYTDTSLTITMWSTPFATGEQTGISEGSSGACDTVVTTRTRTYVDGRPPETDTFDATYRPGDGISC